MKLKLLVASIMASTLVQCKSTNQASFSIASQTPFAVCYAKVTPDQLQNYSMVIIEPDFYSKEEMAALRATGTKIIAYITLGEVDTNRWYYPRLAEIGFLGKNENWNSFFVDLEKDETRQIILTEVLPRIAEKEVDGFFLDTVDAVSPVTERAHLQPYMVQLIEGIRKRYPAKIIIQNAGVFLLEETKDDIDAFLTEALASDYDFEKKEYKIRTAQEYNERLEYLNHYSEKSGKPYFIVGFADTDLKRSQIKTRLDTLARPYFISNIGLSELPVLPDSVANTLKAGRL
ncbi:endo alpha-1,4 polygalactosaminidase [Gracilimonas sp.]|uniref:endo alpha-1,4 polygalactosaminidase n=1 Tax=Gracilimonas sp. TaxID=1974203 RepID=UPI0032EE1DDC